MLAVASPSSKSLAVVWRKDLATAAVALAAASVRTVRARSARIGAVIVRDTWRFRLPLRWEALDEIGRQAGPMAKPGLRSELFSEDVGLHQDLEVLLAADELL